MALDRVLQDLTSDDTANVNSSARTLGLLLERARFSRRGEGNLGDTNGLLGDLPDVELTDRQFEEVLTALVAHLEERGKGANPTVVWAIGKAHHPASTEPLAALADQIMDDPSRSALLYQLISVLAVVEPARNEAVLSRAARHAPGEAGDLARNLIRTHGWE